MDEREKTEAEAAAAPIERTAPMFPWEIALRNSETFYQRLPGGGMVLKFATLARTPMGFIPMAPAVEIEFGPEGWEHFQEEVAAGEKKKVDRVEIATTLPPGVRIDGH